jgi:hypothetical protein
MIGIIALALAGGLSVGEPPVPPEIVFDVCRAGWPDVDRDGFRLASPRSLERERRALELWALNEVERDYVRSECAAMADRIVKRLATVTFDAETLKPQRTFEASNQR